MPSVQEEIYITNTLITRIQHFFSILIAKLKYILSTKTYERSLLWSFETTSIRCNATPNKLHIKNDKLDRKKIMRYLKIV